MVQPRKANGTAKNKAAHKQQQADAAVATIAAKSAKAAHGHGASKKNPVSAGKHDRQDFYNPAFQADKTSVPAISNPNLTKKHHKMIEKMLAKIEYHEIRDEYEQADKLREQILAIEDDANMKALKKAERRAATAE